jgi:hypothetical protein
MCECSDENFVFKTAFDVCKSIWDRDRFVMKFVLKPDTGLVETVPLFFFVCVKLTEALWRNGEL